MRHIYDCLRGAIPAPTWQPARRASSLREEVARPIRRPYKPGFARHLLRFSKRSIPTTNRAKIHTGGDSRVAATVTTGNRRKRRLECLI